MNLLRIDDLTQDDLFLLLHLADESRRNPIVAHKLLRDDAVLLHFERPTPLARLAFASAVSRLGGTPVETAAGDLPLESAESIRDTANALSGEYRAVVVRMVDEDALYAFASAASVPVVNAQSENHDPCQAIADLVTLQQRFGSLAGVRVGFVGAVTPAANSLVGACALAGVDIVVATPPGYELDADVMAGAEETAMHTGALVLATHDPYRAVAGAHAVCTGPWPTGPGADEALRPYRVDEALLGMADDSAVFLHSLPADRSREVSAAVIDGRRSMTAEQADNRSRVASAVLRALIGRRLSGSRHRAFLRIA